MRNFMGHGTDDVARYFLISFPLRYFNLLPFMHALNEIHGYTT